MNTTPEQNKPRLSTTARIVLPTIVIGYLSGLGGCYGGVHFLPDNNLAGLLFVPVGAIGIAIGMALGIAWSAFRKDGHSLVAELWWIGALWALTVLVSIKLDCDILFVSLQAVPLLLCLLVATNKRLLPRIPTTVRRFRFLFAVIPLLFFATSLFPPVTQPRWTPDEQRLVFTKSNPMPNFVFCADPRLDASRSYPQLAVDGNRLMQRWLSISTGTGLLIAILQIHNKRRCPHEHG